jgi:hypothetical protein
VAFDSQFNVKNYLAYEIIGGVHNQLRLGGKNGLSRWVISGRIRKAF